MTNLSSDQKCIFCQIVAGKLPCQMVWEDSKHLAFLSIFPNTDGVTVVIPKQHYPSYLFDLPEPVYQELLQATKTVAKKLDQAFADVARTGLIAEGFGVDHVHTKLFPMHGTANLKSWRPIESKRTDFYREYPGFLSSHDGDRAYDQELAKIAAQIRSGK